MKNASYLYPSTSKLLADLLFDGFGAMCNISRATVFKILFPSTVAIKPIPANPKYPKITTFLTPE